jgi:tetratricopeptide (TPR) repeat protein
MEIVYLIIGVAAVLFLFTLTSPRASMGSRSSFARADDLILKAESAMLRGQYDEAYSLYQSVLAPARQSGCGLFEAEAYYGMARIHEKQGNLPAARNALIQALSNRQTWESEKPNFAALITRTLAEIDERSPR